MLAIVPARAGSVGVYRKNLRQVGGVPLAIGMAHKLKQAPGIDRVVVSTDDGTIAALARLHGYEVHTRAGHLADDMTTVQMAAYYICQELGWAGPVGVFQPTSPLLRAETISQALMEWAANEWDSLASVVADTGLIHGHEGEPLFAGYDNRQSLRPNWRRTGGIQLARSMPAPGAPYPDAPLVGRVHHLYEIDAEEGLDLDTPAELLTARTLANRAVIHFRVLANKKVGMGHLHRALQLVQELDHHHITIHLHRDSESWAIDHVPERYRVRWPEEPDLVVFDQLDTSLEEVAAVKATGARVMCLEDLGPGSSIADVVVNELYQDPRANALTGGEYAVLRPEFVGLPPHIIEVDAPYTVMVSFGGTDPAGLSSRVAGMLGFVTGMCHIRVIQPPAAPIVQDLSSIRTTLVTDPVMAEELLRADLLVCSAGRTVHEAAACGTPTITIAANARESRHVHCPGTIHMGLWASMSEDQLTDCVLRVLKSADLREEMSRTMKAAVDGKGARRIAHMIEAMVEGL